MRRGGHGPVGRATASHHVEVARRHFRVPADGCIRVRTYSRSDVRTWVCGYEPPKLLCTTLSTWLGWAPCTQSMVTLVLVRTKWGVYVPWRLAALGSGSREPSRRGSSKISRTVVFPSQSGIKRPLWWPRAFHSTQSPQGSLSKCRQQHGRHRERHRLARHRLEFIARYS